MDMLLGLDMLKRHQVSKPLLKQLLAPLVKCLVHQRRLSCEFIGSFLGRADGGLSARQLGVKNIHVLDSYRASGCSLQVFALLRDAQSFAAQ